MTKRKGRTPAHTEKLNVLYHGRLAGTLTQAPEYRIAFAYSDAWLKDGFSISPFSLPLRPGVFLAEKMTFSGLFGIFHDSLPDAWGNLLLKRVLEKNGLAADEITVLDRLAYVGHAGRGALEYEPAREGASGAEYTPEAREIDRIAEECREVLGCDPSAAAWPGSTASCTAPSAARIDELFDLGGSCGGSRPKINLRWRGEDWILKFPARGDSSEIGSEEYAYASCARACGIRFPQTHLFPSDRCRRYFAVQRFDRADGRKVHMATAAALLEADPDIPSLDYSGLLQLTAILGNHDPRDLQQMYLRMCFNFFSHNMDDHAANFTWIYEEQEDRWRLSPAYDLTCSSTGYGEHTTSADGYGINPPDTVLIRIGTDAGLPAGWCRAALERVRKTVAEMLSFWIHSRE